MSSLGRRMNLGMILCWLGFHQWVPLPEKMCGGRCYVWFCGRGDPMGGRTCRAARQYDLI